MDIEDEEPWLRRTIGHLRKALPLVGPNRRAEAALQTLARAMERRLETLANTAACIRSMKTVAPGG